MLKATVIHDYTSLDIMTMLTEHIDTVKQRPTAAIEEPYAVFQFSDAIEFNEPFVLEFEFQEAGNSNIHYKQSIEVPYAEERTKGFLFWDHLMSI